MFEIDVLEMGSGGYPAEHLFFEFGAGNNLVVEVYQMSDR